MNCLLSTLCFAYLLPDPVAAYDPLPRWGQATVVINDALFVHGGKTDQYNSYSYSSAPTNGDLLFLSLSSSFDASSPPWQFVSSSTSQGLDLAWHTLSAFNTTGIFLFGGQPGPNSLAVLVDRPDSASLLDVHNRVDPEWIPRVSWTGQPQRRIHHSTATTSSGLIFVIGGEKADGSNNAYSEHYFFNHAGLSFTQLPGDNGPSGIYGHASVILPDGRLLVFGGYSQPQATLLPFSMIFVMDTTRSELSWSTLSTSNSSLPPPRRAFAAASLSDGRILIHGGSDAVLQNNLDDGWILDTSQDPMVWTQIDTLSELGARREHFAVSCGNQVIFGFGYGSNAPAPAVLKIFDVVKGSLESIFTPPSPSSSPTQTLPGASQTSDHGTGTQGGDSTTTMNAHPDSGGDGNSHSRKTTAIAVGTVFGFIGLVVVVLAVYYARRRQHRTRSERRFMALNRGSDGNDDVDSVHTKEGIPAARSFAGPVSYEEHGRGFGVLDTIGLAGIIRAATGGKTVHHVPERRDMLADEDTREFGEWYDTRRRDGSGGSAWSLRSILGARIRSREPSATGTLGEGVVWREKSDPFSDEAALVRDEETGYVASAVTVAERPPGQRQSHSASRDYVQVQRLDRRIEEEAALSQRVSSNHPSQNTLVATRDPPASSVSSLSTSLPPNSPLGSSSSNITYHTSLLHPRSPGVSPSSIIGSTPKRMSQTIRRSDSWWSRFSHTSFLDRRASDPSRSSAMLDIRDPNPRPQLIAIEESTHSTPLDHEENILRLPSDSVNRGQSFSKKMSDSHNKSLTSLRTADTETIERMAGAMDVVQRVRTASSNQTIDTTTSSADSLNMDVYSDPLGEEKGIFAAGHEEPMPPTLSPIGIPYTESSGQSQRLSSIMTKIPPSSPSYTSSPSPRLPATPSHLPRVGVGQVASRIREYERQMSLDREVPQPTNTRQREERYRKKGTSVTVNYGLVKRPSLFVANPDGRTTPCRD